MNKAEELNAQLTEWRQKNFDADLKHLHAKAIDRIQGAISYKHSEKTNLTFWYDSYKHTQELAARLETLLKPEGFFIKWSTSPDDSVTMDISTIAYKTEPTFWQSLKAKWYGIWNRQ